jgi:hypothetical protein
MNNNSAFKKMSPETEAELHNCRVKTCYNAKLIHSQLKLISAINPHNFLFHYHVLLVKLF